MAKNSNLLTRLDGGDCSYRLVRALHESVACAKSQGDLPGSEKKYAQTCHLVKWVFPAASVLSREVRFSSFSMARETLAGALTA